MSLSLALFVLLAGFVPGVDGESRPPRPSEAATAAAGAETSVVMSVLGTGCRCCTTHPDDFMANAFYPPYPMEMGNSNPVQVPYSQADYFPPFKCAIVPPYTRMPFGIPMASGYPMVVEVGRRQEFSVLRNITPSTMPSGPVQTHSQENYAWSATGGAVLPENANGMNLDRRTWVYDPGSGEYFPMASEGLPYPVISFPEAGTATLSVQFAWIWDFLYGTCLSCNHSLAPSGRTRADERGSDTVSIVVVEVESLDVADATAVMVEGREDWIIAAAPDLKIQVKATPNPVVEDERLPSDWAVIFTGPNNQVLPAGRVTPKTLDKENEEDPDVLSRTEFEIDGSVPAIYHIRAKCGTSAKTLVLYVVGIEMRDGNSAPTISNVVGKRMDLSIQLLPSGLPNDFSVQNPQWLIVGSKIKSFAANSRQGGKTALTTADMSKEAISFYWYKAEDASAGFTCHVKGISLEAVWVFLVRAPTVSLKKRHENSVRMEVFTAAGIPPIGKIIMKYGQSNVNAGIDLGGTVGSVGSVGFSGCWIQLISTTTDYYKMGSGGIVHSRKTTNGSYVLDKTYPYNTISEHPDFASPWISMQDSPGTTLDREGDDRGSKAEDSFKAFFMIKPNLPDSVWVPSHVINWGWKGLLMFDEEDGVWSVTDDSCNVGEFTVASDYPKWLQNVDEPPWIIIGML